MIFTPIVILIGIIASFFVANKSTYGRWLVHPWHPLVKMPPHDVFYFRPCWCDEASGHTFIEHLSVGDYCDTCFGQRRK